MELSHSIVIQNEPFRKIKRPFPLTTYEKDSRAFHKWYEQKKGKMPIILEPYLLAEVGIEPPYQPYQIYRLITPHENEQKVNYPDQLKRAFYLTEKCEADMGISTGFFESPTNQFCLTRIVVDSMQKGTQLLKGDSTLGQFLRINGIKIFDENVGSISESAGPDIRSAIVYSSHYLYHELPTKVFWPDWTTNQESFQS